MNRLNHLTTLRRIRAGPDNVVESKNPHKPHAKRDS
jgi:hypothetical protein